MTNRRYFLKLLGIGAGALTILRPTLAWAKKLAIPLEKVEKLQKPGGWAVLRIKDRDILFIRDTETTVRALDSVCSHKQCTVGYDPQANQVACPCHGSVYDLDGKVKAGPAPKPLQVFPATLQESRIIIEMEDAP